jgi:hypothetical protein
LEKDGSRGLFGISVMRGNGECHLPVITTKSGRYPFNCVGASGTTIASLSHTDSHSRQATHLVLLDEGDLVVVGQRLVLRVDHADALERADVDAELATGAELLDDLGLGISFGLTRGM